MLSTYNYPRYAHRRAAELDAPGPIKRHPWSWWVPARWAWRRPSTWRNGLPVLLLDDDDTVSVGSRGLCYAKRALEVLDRLGCGEPVVQKGVTWNVGRTFYREDEVFSFNLQPEPGHRRPGMVNLQQYYLEEYQVARVAKLPLIDLRWKNQVTAVTPQGDGALQVQTPEGNYACKPTG
jgi:3-(3-hydroxy-phenyl)propionate hydroxylase